MNDGPPFNENWHSWKNCSIETMFLWRNLSCHIKENVNDFKDVHYIFGWFDVSFVVVFCVSVFFFFSNDSEYCSVVDATFHLISRLPVGTFFIWLILDICHIN